MQSAANVEAVSRSRWARQVDKQTLGGHYSYIVGHPGGRRRDPEKERHDRMLAENAHAFLPASVVGFTDRSRRLREGQGAREVFMPHISELDAWIAGAEDNYSAFSVTASALDAPPAGLGNPVEPESKRFRKVRRRDHDEDGASVLSSVASDNVASVLGQAIEALERLPDRDDDVLAIEMCRKAKKPGVLHGAHNMMPHRGDSRGPTAGNYKVDHKDMKSKARQGPRSNEPRSGVAQALLPKDGDPALPEKVFGAMAKKKAEFAFGHSEEASRHSQAANPQNFRFAANPKPLPRRSHGAPAPQAPPGAGRPSKAGLPSRQKVSERSKKIPEDTSKMPFQSRGVGKALDREGAHREAKEEHSMRQENDPDYASVCSYTAYNKQVLNEDAGAIKKKMGNFQSAGMANQLVWEVDPACLLPKKGKFHATGFPLAAKNR